MIKGKPFNSVTERQGRAVATVDRKISSPASRSAFDEYCCGFLVGGGYRD